MGLSLGQTPPGIGDYGISPIITDLLEDIPQARPTSVSVQLERFSKVGIGQNVHCGAQMLHLHQNIVYHRVNIFSFLSQELQQLLWIQDLI